MEVENNRLTYKQIEVDKTKLDSRKAKNKYKAPKLSCNKIVNRRSGILRSVYWRNTQ